MYPNAKVIYEHGCWGIKDVDGNYIHYDGNKYPLKYRDGVMTGCYIQESYAKNILRKLNELPTKRISDINIGQKFKYDLDSQNTY